MKFYFEIDNKEKKKSKAKSKKNAKGFSPKTRIIRPYYNFFLFKRTKILFVLILMFLLYIGAIYLSGAKNIFSTLFNLPSVFYKLASFFMPSLSALTYLEKILKNYVKSLLIAISSTTFASIFALVVAIFSVIIGKESNIPSRFFSFGIRGFASLCRNIPLPAWVILFLFSFGQNGLTGFLVLFIVSFGYLTRIFRELIEEDSYATFVALRAIGLPYFSAITQGILPNIRGKFIAWLLYTLATNIRDSSLVGILTGHGVGFLFNLFFRSFRYDAVGILVIILSLTVLLFDFFSNRIREFVLRRDVRYFELKKRLSHIIFYFLFLISFLSFFLIDMGSKSIGSMFSSLITNINDMFFRFYSTKNFSFTSLCYSSLVSLALAFLATFVSIIISLPIAMLNTKNIFKTNVIGYFINAISSFVRSVPTIIWVMLFSLCIGVGARATIIGLSLHSIAYLVYAFSMSFDSVDATILDAMRSVGASKLIVIFRAIWPLSIKSIISWSFFRFEINFMNAVALGSVAGAGGIGYELFIAGSMEFDVRGVGLISYFLLFICLILESISNRLKRSGQ